MGAPFKEETADAHVLLREEEEGALLMIVLLRLVPHFLLFPSPVQHLLSSTLALSSHHLTPILTQHTHIKRRCHFAVQNTAARQRKEGGTCSNYIF